MSTFEIRYVRGWRSPRENAPGVLRLRNSDVPVIPLIALSAAAIASIALAAQAGMAFCPDRVRITLPQAICGAHVLLHVPAAAGAEASAGNGIVLSICPISLTLLVIATALGGWAVVAARRDRHASLTARLLMRRLSRLPVAVTAAALAAVAAIPVGMMLALAPDISATALNLFTMFGVVLATALGLTLAIVAGARTVVAFGRRTVARLLMIWRCAQTPPLLPRAPRRRAVLTAADVAGVASGRGFRAPPFLLN
jgi:hypothetical protein